MLNASKWRSARSTSPCPICGKPDWCQLAVDGRGAICRRIQSDKPQKSGGWFHHVNNGAAPMAADRPAPRPAPQPSIQELHLLAWSYQQRDQPTLDATLRAAARSQRRVPGAARRRFLGRAPRVVIPDARRRRPRARHPHASDVRQEVLHHRGEGRAFHSARSSRRSPVRLRGPNRHRRDAGPGLRRDRSAELHGRAAADRGSAEGASSFAGNAITRLVIVADGDAPGQRGAQQLAVTARLYCPIVQVITPPAGIKDARAWKRGGATAADVERAVWASPQRQLKVVSTLKGIGE
jgi:hypothetical protein